MDSANSQYSYSNCLKRSQKAAWDLEFFEDIELDFNKPFLPEALAQTEKITFLNEQEKLQLNQIRGYTYAYLFRFVEEYIIGLVDELHSEHEDGTAQQALNIFLEEEKKHQKLFQLFETCFKQGFSSECQVVGDMQVVADAILEHSRLSVLYLTAMLEWLTQAHYLAYFEERDESVKIDDAFKELFRLHWVEEAQHARLDELEVLRAVDEVSLAERQEAIKEFLKICDIFFGILKAQAQFDVESLALASGLELELDKKTEIISKQSVAYFHTFIRLGLLNRHFRDLIETVAPGSVAILDDYLKGYADAE